ncbi:hypothetical protein ACYX7E_01025 [Luteimonas sp. RIT-PG2_3]
MPAMTQVHECDRVPALAVFSANRNPACAWNVPCQRMRTGIETDRPALSSLQGITPSTLDVIHVRGPGNDTCREFHPP